jgi:hypothetical protein
MGPHRALRRVVLAVVWVVRERRDPVAAVEVPWSALDLRSLVIAVLLLPVAVLLFRAGEGIDGMIRLGTAATILQWILLTQALSAPSAGPLDYQRQAAETTA